MSKPTADFWGLIGFGIMVFLILLGMGGCAALSNLGESTANVREVMKDNTK